MVASNRHAPMDYDRVRDHAERVIMELGVVRDALIEEARTDRDRAERDEGFYQAACNVVVMVHCRARGIPIPAPAEIHRLAKMLSEAMHDAIPRPGRG